MDRAAIEAALDRYAEALDWPRGTGWEEGFSPVDPATWPVEQWEGGYEIFRSLFTDDALLDYGSLCMTIEAGLPEGTIDFLGPGDESCPVLGLRIKGSLDFFYYGITLGTQLESTNEDHADYDRHRWGYGDFRGQLRAHGGLEPPPAQRASARYRHARRLSPR